MLKGTIYITYDFNLCLANLNSCKTIAVMDEPDMYNIPGKVGGSILIPPYEALACVIDGDEAKFNSYYITYLCSDIIVHKFVNIILNALMVGTNIILLLDPEGPKFDMPLKQYFANSFGIYIGDGANQFQFDMNFIPVILSRLYLDDNIDTDWFLKLYPTELPFDQIITQKLSFDSGVSYISEVQNQSYFKNISNILKTGGTIRNVVKRI